MPILQPRQIGKLKVRRIALADQKERIARRDLAEANQRRSGIIVARLHHAHRPAPRDVDRAIEQTRRRGSRRRRVEQFDLDALAGIEAERMRGVEWGVEHRAKILGELDVHGRSSVTASGSGGEMGEGANR